MQKDAILHWSDLTTLFKKYQPSSCDLLKIQDMYFSELHIFKKKNK